jgi:hypothetical protein
MMDFAFDRALRLTKIHAPAKQRAKKKDNK